MSTPRDRDGFDDDEAGRAWQEPAHLSGDDPAEDAPNFADRRKQPRDSDHSTEGAGWQPPGWDLPPATPDRGQGVDPSWAPPSPQEPPSPQGPPAPQEPRRTGGLFGGRQRQRDPEMERAFTYEGDQLGAQSWALQQGWTVSDGSGPGDAVLAELLAGAPVRPGKEARAAGVLRGRAGQVELVAFDVVYPWGRQWVAKYAITAAPLLGAVPALRLSRRGCGSTAPAGWCRCPAGTRPSTAAGSCSRPRTVRRCAASCRTPPSRGCSWAPTTATSSGPAPGTWPPSVPTATVPS